MTCVVGIEQDGIVWLGADSSSIEPHSMKLQIVSEPKAFAREEFAAAFTTSFRMGQLLEHAFSPPPRPEGATDVGYLVSMFLDELRRCFREHGFVQTANDEHATGQELGGEFLLAYRGRLYQVFPDFNITRPARGFAAAGCGEQVALGSLHATHGKGAPGDRILAALSAAEEFSAGVRGPFTVISFPEAQPERTKRRR